MPSKKYLQVLRERMEAFTPQKTTSEEQTLFVRSLKQFIDEKYLRPANVYCIVKKLLRVHNDEGLNKIALNNLRETPEEKKDSKNKAERALEKRNEEVTEFHLDYVVNLIYRLMSSDDWVDIFILLQVCCGARQRDIFDPLLCQFHAEPEETHVLQIGSSKARKKFELKKKLVVITAGDFLRRLTAFRQHVEDASLSASEVTSQWNERLCVRTKFYFPVKGHRSGTHVNRAIYAAMIRLTCPDVTVPRSVQCSLGHESMATSLHYLYVNISVKGGFKGHFAKVQGRRCLFDIPVCPPRLRDREKEKYWQAMLYELQQGGVEPRDDIVRACGFPTRMLDDWHLHVDEV